MNKIIGLFFETEHLIKIGSTLYIIMTSLYDIQEDVTMLKKEHGLLLIGLVGLIKVCFELYEKVSELHEEVGG